MNLFIAVVECAIEHDDKFLIIRRPEGVHAGGLFSLPGGKVEYADGGEHKDLLLEAVKREVHEEVGLTLIDPIRFVTSSFFVDSRKNHILDVIFHCKLIHSDPTVTASPREVPEHYWFTPPELAIHPHAPQWLRRYVALSLRS